MKIAVIVDGWYPAVGGGQINAWEISKRIAKSGVEIDIITRNQGKYNLPTVKNLKIIQLGHKTESNNLLDQILFSARLVPFLLSRNYDLIHTHPFIPVLAAKFVTLLKKIPIVFTVHGTRLFALRKKWSPSLLVEYIIVRCINYDTIISVTEAFKKIADPKQRIVVIPNSVDKKLFSRTKTKTIRGKILWVGRFDAVKKVEDLLEAFIIVKKSVSDSTLTLVGYGYRQNLYQDLTKKMKIKGVMFKGKLSGIDLVKEYKSASIFVLSSDSEGQPISILEAQAAGIPIIAPRVGGIPELLRGKGGILTKPGNVKDLAGSIIYALSNRDELMKRVNKSQNNILSWDDIATKTLAVYSKIMSSHG